MVPAPPDPADKTAFTLDPAHTAPAAGVGVKVPAAGGALTTTAVIADVFPHALVKVTV